MKTGGPFAYSAVSWSTPYLDMASRFSVFRIVSLCSETLDLFWISMSSIVAWANDYTGIIQGRRQVVGKTSFSGKNSEHHPCLSTDREASYEGQLQHELNNMWESLLVETIWGAYSWFPRYNLGWLESWSFPSVNRNYLRHFLRLRPFAPIKSMWLDSTNDNDYSLIIKFTSTGKDSDTWSGASLV